MKPANKVVFNTAILYARVILTAGITLYTTRLVLLALGEIDYGIFNLVAGVILMLSFLNTAMTTSTQRFLAVTMGKEESNNITPVFLNSLIIHIIVGAICFLILEFAFFFVFDLLTVPENRLNAAKTIYQLMVISVVFTILIVPFNALLVAHENMLWVVFTSIVHSLLTLVLALYLHKISSDRLVFFGMMTALINIIVYSLTFLFCIKKRLITSLNIFKEKDLRIVKELAIFGGWSLFGSLCTIARTQGSAIILNIFVGPVINTAYAIANQISNQANYFSSTMLWAINPQIMKSEGSENPDRVNRLSLIACKFGFFLLAFIAVPIIFEMNSILTFWLRSYPDHTEIFCISILVAAMISQLTSGLRSASQALNKIKIYELTTGIALLINIPLIYFLLRIGIPNQFVLLSFIFTQLISYVTQLVIMNKIIGIHISVYIKSVLMKILGPLLLLIMSCFLVVEYLDLNFRFLYTMLISMFIFFLSIYLFGLSRDEKKLIQQLLLSRFATSKNKVYTK